MSVTICHGAMPRRVSPKPIRAAARPPKRPCGQPENRVARGRLDGGVAVNRGRARGRVTPASPKALDCERLPMCADAHPRPCWRTGGGGIVTLPRRSSASPPSPGVSMSQALAAEPPTVATEPARELVLAVTLEGPPYAWERARDTGDGYQNSREYQAWLRRASAVLRFSWSGPPVPGRLHAPKKPPLDEPLALEIGFYFHRPDRRPAVIPKALWDADKCPAVGRMDTDNLAAAIMDAVTQARIWQDDTRVVSLRAAKVYLPKAGGVERTAMKLYRLVVPG